MDKELIIKNIKESLIDLTRCFGEIEQKMHKELILENLKELERAFGIEKQEALDSLMKEMGWNKSEKY